MVAEAVAVAAMTGEECAAPFALPLCSLLDETGRFDDSGVYQCRGERYFTGIRRHCPAANPNCGVLPDFELEPTKRHDPLSHSVIFATSSRMAAYYYDDGCFWPSRRYADRADHFGVVGLPGRSTAGEADVIGILNAGGCINASRGDQFAVLEAGLTANAADAAVWGRVSDPANDPIADVLNTFEVNRYAAPIDPFGILPALDVCTADMPSASNGLCNSHYASFRPLIEELSVLSGAALAARMASAKDEAHQTLSESPVWQVLVPVIADFGADAKVCHGLIDPASGLPASEDPPFEVGNGHEWRIVDFQPIVIYDADIGSAPPLMQLPDPVEFAGHPYRFTAGDGSVQNCNLVRAKMECAPAVGLSSGSGRNMRKAVLVR